MTPHSEKGVCQKCGGHVSKAFRRVHGDQDDVAHRCLTCDTRKRIQNGTAAGLESNRVDPLDQPGRYRYGGEETPERVTALLTDGGEEA